MEAEGWVPDMSAGGCITQTPSSLYFVYIVSWNKKTSMKTDKLTYTWTICSKTFASKIDGKEKI